VPPSPPNAEQQIRHLGRPPSRPRVRLLLKPTWASKLAPTCRIACLLEAGGCCPGPAGVRAGLVENRNERLPAPFPRICSRSATWPASAAEMVARHTGPSSHIAGRSSWADPYWLQAPGLGTGSTRRAAVLVQIIHTSAGRRLTSYRSFMLRREPGPFQSLPGHAAAGRAAYTSFAAPSIDLARRRHDAS